MELSIHIYPTVPIVLALLSVLYMLSAAKWRARSRGRPFPPGPPSLPIIGNLLNIPGDRAWFDFLELAAQYGDIIRLRVLGQSTVVLGSAKIIHEYLDKRASNTSDRPQVPAIDLLGQGTNFGLMPYGQRWRRYRRHFWQHFTSRAVEAYQPLQRAAAYHFLSRLLEEPERVKDHIRWTFLATILKIVYGIDLSADHSDLAANFEVATDGIAEGLTPGKYIFDVLPFLKHVPEWVPGFGFQADFKYWRSAVEAAKNVPFTFTKEAMARGEAQGSLVARIMSSDGTTDEREPDDVEEMAKGIGLVTYQAGADTSFIVTSAFFLAMSLHPKAQRKAQAELDSIVGPRRLPDFSDMESLVYVKALIRETLQWHTITPLGAGHSTTADDELNRYFIPAGTVLLPNIWACMHDPEVYEDPFEFRPERFIRDGKFDLSVRDPVDFVFGFGRRICPGRHFAEAAAFIHIASVLHTFNITPPLDADGHPIQVHYGMTPGFISYPEDCRCTVKPRSVEAASMIMAHARDVALLDDEET